MSEPEQLTSVEDMTSEEIAQAYEEGRLDDYLAQRRSPESDRQRATRELLAEMTAEEVASALQAGALDNYLASKTR